MKCEMLVLEEFLGIETFHECAGQSLLTFYEYLSKNSREVIGT